MSKPRKYAIAHLSRVHAYRKPAHMIDPKTRRTYCQIENSIQALRKFDVLDEGQIMCKNCQSLSAQNSEGMSTNRGEHCEASK